MYDDLHQALVKSHKAVQWFALGEAVKLAATIEKICLNYPKKKKKDENLCEALVKVAERTCDFLKRHHYSGGDEIVKNIQDVLTRIKMEA